MIGIPFFGGGVREMGVWHYSSFRDLAEKRKGAFCLLDIHEDAFIEQLKEILDAEKIEELY